MSRVKNISGGPLDVPLLDTVVQAGEVVDVPDYQPGHSPEDRKAALEIAEVIEVMAIVWPPDKWAPVTEDKPKTRAGKAAV